MASSYNRVILLGNLTRDPETVMAKSGSAVVKFGLAVNRRFKTANGEWVDEPTFIDVTMFGARGEAFAKYHRKGAPAFLEGELRLDTWEDKNGGGKRSKLYVVANSFEFVGGGKNEGGGGARAARDDQGLAPASASDYPSQWDADPF